jgi:hypothetical protein
LSGNGSYALQNKELIDTDNNNADCPCSNSDGKECASNEYRTRLVIKITRAGGHCAVHVPYQFLFRVFHAALTQSANSAKVCPFAARSVQVLARERVPNAKTNDCEKLEENAAGVHDCGCPR